MPTPALLAWSGGKDAAWSLHVLRQRGEFDVVGLLSTITNEDGRSSMQGVRREVLRAQAGATGLPLLEVDLPASCTNKAYEAAMTEALAGAAMRWPDLRTVAFGDLFLADIRAWREQQLARIGWRVATPLFGRETAALAREMIDGGLHASLCCVDTRQLDAAFAGRAFDAALLADLPAGVDACGENGEFHTCVHAGPMFASPLALVRAATSLDDGRFARTDFALADAGPGAPQSSV
ncbi:ATP-binding protein [Luteimonas sp. M1R5S18]|uniref:ATP-binding protein n=1 Tax=Luteimonas rhizosphaericola TaxID=3042024 RepID=A0ABT6JNF3_9GAMM|nr:ATP-binding protein [Luteimonas rhizosphaericola]MDH5831501.1 ATP-binding protein [Luteimonas rhizosphaericola]